MKTSTYVKDSSTRDTIVADLWAAGWFHKTARFVVRGYTELNVDDVASESVFTAMRAAESWRDVPNSDVGGWVKYRTRLAMIHEVRKHANEQKNFVNIDALTPLVAGGDVTPVDLVDTAPSAEDEMMRRAWGTYSAEIEDAVSQLTAKQQSITRARMAGIRQRDPARPRAYGSWSDARNRLRVRLSHLKWLVRP